MFAELQISAHTRVGPRRIRFRYLHVHTQLVSIGEAEQGGAGALTRVDQRAHIGVAQGDDPSKAQRRA